eukprot:scaffold1960_cov332-Prasinococcus_capsulatus_cf.AAC.10
MADWGAAGDGRGAIARAYLVAAEAALRRQTRSGLLRPQRTWPAPEEGRRTQAAHRARAPLREGWDCARSRSQPR